MTNKLDTIEVRIEQGQAQGEGRVSLAGYWALRESKLAQTDYLMACYVPGAAPTYPPGFIGSRTRDGLRRIAVLACQQGRGIPAVDGVLLAVGDWKACVGGVMVRYVAGYVPVLADAELVGKLDVKRLLYIRETCGS